MKKNSSNHFGMRKNHRLIRGRATLKPHIKDITWKYFISCFEVFLPTTKIGLCVIVLNKFHHPDHALPVAYSQPPAPNHKFPLLQKFLIFFIIRLYFKSSEDTLLQCVFTCTIFPFSSILISSISSKSSSSNSSNQSASSDPPPHRNSHNPSPLLVQGLSLIHI